MRLGKVCIRTKRPIRLALISDFSSMKRPRAGLLHLGGERHSASNVSCPRTQHNFPGQCPNTGSTRSGALTRRPPRLQKVAKEYKIRPGYPDFKKKSLPRAKCSVRNRFITRKAKKLRIAKSFERDVDS